MKRLLNFGVSDPLTLGMAHPVAARLETLGRARPATWKSRALALSAMTLISISTAPITAAESVSKSDLGLTISVIPDMTDIQVAELQSRMDKLSSGQADKEILTQFIMNSGRFVARYDADEKIIDLKFNIPVPNVKEVMDAMPNWLERCGGLKAFKSSYERTEFSWGAATVHCNALRLPKRPDGQENK